MSTPDFDGLNPFEDVLKTLTTLQEKGTVELVPKDSTQADINKVINDNIYGLLSSKSITAEQVTLLAALLQTKG